MSKKSVNCATTASPSALVIRSRTGHGEKAHRQLPDQERGPWYGRTRRHYPGSRITGPYSLAGHPPGGCTLAQTRLAQAYCASVPYRPVWYDLPHRSVPHRPAWYNYAPRTHRSVPRVTLSGGWGHVPGF
eukprot:3200282-Rhodomonas_salina.2